MPRTGTVRSPGGLLPSAPDGALHPVSHYGSYPTNYGYRTLTTFVKLLALRLCLTLLCGSIRL